MPEIDFQSSIKSRRFDFDYEVVELHSGAVIVEDECGWYMQADYLKDDTIAHGSAEQAWRESQGEDCDNWRNLSYNRKYG